MSKQLLALIQSAEPWSLSTVGPVLGALALTSLVLSWTRKSLPNEPPMVPYLIPWIGHSLSLLMDSKRFLADAKAKYGEMYSIIFFGRTFVVVSGKSLITEVFKAGDDNINFRAAASELVPAERVFHLSYAHKCMPNFRDISIVPVIRSHLKSHQLGVFYSQIVEATKTAIDIEIGPNGTKWNDPWRSLQQIVARISSLCFAGDEIGRDETLITMMAEITNKLVLAGIVSSNLPLGLGNFLVKHLFSITAELDVIYDRAKPLLDKRLVKKQQQPDWEPPQDMLQWMQDVPQSNGEDRKTGETSIMLTTAGFASIHTTSMSCLFAFHELINHPEVVTRLRAVISKAIADAGGVLTPEVTDKIPELDSFLRETLRLNNDILGMRHLAMRDYAFRNGMTVKKGSVLVIPILSVQCDPEIQPTGGNEDLEDFDAFRFLGYPSRKAYNVSPSYVVFGEGPHTCPGRFFAVQEIKYIVASVLMRYNIKTTLKGRAPNRYTFGMIASPPDAPIIFEPIKE